MKIACCNYCRCTLVTYLIAITVAVFFLVGCAGTPRFTHSLDRDINAPAIVSGSFEQTGMASYYAREFDGRKTASGERYDMNDFTAAHPALPFGTRVKVTNLSNHQSVVVRVNDRGPHKKNRIIDMSFSAAKKIGLIASGTAKVSLEVVK